MNWLLQNANVVSALASAGMLVIWSMYAWLFYQEFLRQRGSQLFIHEAGAVDNPGSTCMLVNLSKEPIHILCSMAAHGDRVVQLLDTEEQGNGAGPVQRNKQGPLGMGEPLQLGSFDKICHELGLTESADDQDFSQFEIRVAAIHGFREWPIGARRRFRIDHRNSCIWPMQEHTEQLRSKRQAAEVLSWVQSCRSEEPRQ